MRDERLFLPDFKTDPYWWDVAPRPHLERRDLPRAADVVIVGSGFTGLAAALDLARGGRDVAILDAGDPGIGASSRNFGMIGRQVKHGFNTLLAQLGEAPAKAIYGEVGNAFAFVVDLIKQEGIECGLTQWGRFVGANTPAHYETLARELEARHRHLGHEFEMLPGRTYLREFGSERYSGGGVIPEHYMLHPARFHQGLLDRVIAAGAAIHSRVTVTAYGKESGGWAIATNAGTIRARELVIATNGYTGAFVPYLHRRVVPINAYLIATEPLARERLAGLIPNGRGFHDTNHHMECARISPDGSRLIFGGLTGYPPGDLAAIGARLRAKLIAVFPTLATVRLSHAWTGACAGTFDFYPHKGSHDGMRYALGYCFGAGMPLGTWLGHRTAESILTGTSAATAFDALDFPAKSYYRGRAWFMPLLLGSYTWRDRIDRWRARFSPAASGK